MNSIALNERTLKRFWGKVDVRSGNECWNRKGSLSRKNGYGNFTIRLKSIGAHRFSYSIHFGDIPDGLIVCHKCDNPQCVNPNHLFLGTNADNQRDKKLKGRSARGAKNNKTKLTEENVREIRVLISRGLPSREIASRFGVLHAAILTIKNRKTWAWLE